MQLSDELLEKIGKAIREEKPTYYWDYRDELNEEQVAEIFKGNSNDVMEEIYDNCMDSIINIEEETATNVVKEFMEEIHAEFKKNDVEYDKDEQDEDELAKEIVEEFDLRFEVDLDMDFEQLFKNTGDVSVRVTMFSNYDCINSHWFETQGGGGYSYKESYFGAMVDQLNLNPAKVKKMLLEKDINCFGAFPNKKNRDGKEFVSYSDFWQELENSTCGGNLLTFVGKVDLNDMYNLKEGELVKVIIPKGNYAGIFSSMQGGGSLMEMELLRDKEINLIKPYGKTKYDSYGMAADNNGDDYSINSVYGMTREFWGKELTLISKK